MPLRRGRSSSSTSAPASRGYIPSRHPPAPAAKRAWLLVSTAPEDDALLALPPDSRHYPGLPIAEGLVRWEITPFEGNFYIRKRHLLADRFRPNFIPGLYPYKFLCVWFDFRLPDGGWSRNIGWLYWLPNPLFPVIWNRVAVPKNHPGLRVEEFDGGQAPVSVT